MRVDLIEGDITTQQVDAIVNAANSSLLGGSGVDGAIHRKGGPQILEETRALRAAKYGRGLPVGQAVATTAGLLPARWVIHTVGPVYSETEDRTPLLQACYRNTLQVADDLGATSIAYPLISAGIYRWPLDAAITEAWQILKAATPANVQTASLILFTPETAEKARAIAAAL